MNKRSLTIATTFGLAYCYISGVAHANDAPPYENWIGLSGQFYNADNDKNPPTGGLDTGRGFSGEIGYRFDESWAARFELGRVFINDDVRSLGDDDGVQVSVDAMYFLPDDLAYVFGGLREQSLKQNHYGVASMGVGKHWAVSEKWRVITELGYYYDFGQKYTDYSVKLGISYLLGTKPVSSTSNKDSDNDGVYDAQDSCPNTPPNRKVDTNGCEIKDPDDDGIVTAMDDCPNTAAGARVNDAGCSPDLDSDNDGVFDSKDKCPNTPITDKVDENGCSIFEQKQVSVALDVLFANNSAVISNPESEKIVEFVSFMKRYPSTEAVIEGHTSAVGSVAYNQRLSEERAQAIKKLLIERFKIDESRLKAVGYGETRLKDTSNTSEAHRVNRRIEVKVSAIIEEKVNR